MGTYCSECDIKRCWCDCECECNQWYEYICDNADCDGYEISCNRCYDEDKICSKCCSSMTVQKYD